MKVGGRKKWIKHSKRGWSSGQHQRLMYTTSGHFMVLGALEEDGGWKPDLVVSNTDKKNWPHRINTDEDCVDIGGNQD